MAHPPATHPFDAALAVAAGHAPAATLEPAARSWLPLAQRVRSARLRVRAVAPCPRAVRRRVEAALAGKRAAPAGIRWAALVFDSWSGMAAAARGTPVKRMLEYRTDGVVLYVQVRPTGAEAVKLHFATDRPGVEFHVHLGDPEPRSLVVQADRHGVGSVELAPGEFAQTICVLEHGVEVFRAATPQPNG